MNMNYGKVGVGESKETSQKQMIIPASSSQCWHLLYGLNLDHSYSWLYILSFILKSFFSFNFLKCFSIIFFLYKIFFNSMFYNDYMEFHKFLN